MAWFLDIPRAFWRAVRPARGLHLSRLAASIAYYALFSLPALLVVAINLAGVVYGEAATRARLIGQISRYVGADLAATVDSVIAGAAAEGATHFLPRALAIAALFFGASLTFVELQHALNVIWRTTPPRRWYVSVVLKRLLSFAMVLVVGGFLMASMAASVGIARFGTWVTEHVPRDLALGLLSWLEPGLALAALTLLCLLLFKLLPDARVPWKRAWVAAVVTGVLLVAAKAAVGRYLAVVDLASVYGAAGSLVVLLVWVYASCLAVLLGGAFAFTWEEVRSAPPAPPHP